MLINECKPEFQFKKSSKNAKFGQCLYLVAHFCYEQNRCAERTVKMAKMSTVRVGLENTELTFEANTIYIYIKKLSV